MSRLPIIGEIIHRRKTIKGETQSRTPLFYQSPKPDRSKYADKLRELRVEHGVGRPPHLLKRGRE